MDNKIFPLMDAVYVGGSLVGLLVVLLIILVILRLVGLI